MDQCGTMYILDQGGTVDTVDSGGTLVSVHQQYGVSSINRSDSIHRAHGEGPWQSLTEVT